MAALDAGVSAIDRVSDDRQHDEQHDSRDVHQAGVGDVARPFRLGAGHGGYGGDQNGGGQPEEPRHAWRSLQDSRHSSCGDLIDAGANEKIIGCERRS